MSAATSTAVALPADAVLRPLPLPAGADAEPTPLIREYAEVRNACIREVTGRDDDAMPAEALLDLLRSDPDARRQQWYVQRHGALVGCAALNLSLDDGGQSATGTIALRRAHWGAGIGTAVLDTVESHARTEGARKMVTWQEHHPDASVADVEPAPTGFGAVPRDHAARFLVRHGFRLEQVVRASSFAFDSAALVRLERLRDEAARRAQDYRIVQWMLPTPDARLEGYAWLKSRMSTDVPDADLGTPAEIWDAERVRRHDRRYTQRGAVVQVTAAEHVATGELCAFNELAVFGAPTSKTDQEDTLVLADHRGHRLGMLVKTAGLLSWHARHPQSPRVVTYNAEENRPMLSINEAIGFVPVAYEGAWRKDLT